MDGPGMSLFQGSESLHVDTDKPRIEEEEAIQDQQRRNEELGNLLTNAFDDLIDDDDGSSVISNDTNHARSRTSLCLSGGGDATVSGHSAHYKHCYGSKPGSVDVVEHPNEWIDAKEVPVVNGHSTEPLKSLYDVRTREIQRLAKETDQWRHQVALKDAEKERLQMSLNQQANQLAKANNRVEDLAAEVVTLKQNVRNAENSKSSVIRELESCRATISDLRSRCESLQQSRDEGRHADAILLSSEQRHVQETKTLLTRIDDLRNDFTLKTVELQRTRHKMAQMSRDHEALLLQRTEEIQQLTMDLEATQRQAKQLAAEIDVAQAKGGHHGSRKAGNVSELNELNGKLKEELERCVGGLRAKTEENRKLQEMLDMKETVVKTLLDQEARCTTQVTRFREETEQLYQECKEKELRESELRKVNERLRDANEKLKKDVASLELQAAKKKLVFSAQANAGTSPRQDVDDETAQLGSRLESALAENEQIKQLYLEICEVKDQTISELTRLRTEYNRLWSRPDDGAMELGTGNGEQEAENTSIFHMAEELALEVVDWNAQIEQLKSHFQSKLDQEITRQALQFRETEEQIKDEAVKLFSDDIEALEMRRDEAVDELKQCRNKLTAAEARLRDFESAANTELRRKDDELTRLRKDCDDKVSLLREAERRFEVFEGNTCDEFARLSGEQQKTIEKLVVKYKALKRLAKELKAQVNKGKGKKGWGDHRSKVEAYRSALSEIDRRMADLVERTGVGKEAGELAK